MKVAISKDYGGFPWEFRNLARNDKILISMIKIGQKQGYYNHIKIVEIPDDVEFVIEDYDGIEWVAEKHRIWR